MIENGIGGGVCLRLGRTSRQPVLGYIPLEIIFPVTQGVTDHMYDEPVVIYSFGEPTFYLNIPPRLRDRYIFCLFSFLLW